MGEGLTLVGAPAALAAFFGGVQNPVSSIVFRSSAAFLVALGYGHS
ncbi:MAG: hypothetical protein QMC96_09340 [Methanomicrobiales archaeon]|nr:hypothetical protein [Methanomicrobiales archaeon]